MTTRTEKRLINLSNKRQRLIKRIEAAGNRHKQVAGYQAELVRATVQEIRTQMALERKGRAA